MKNVCLLLFLPLLLTACHGGGRQEGPDQTPEAAPSYTHISPEEAKSKMDADPDALILDVREQSEYDTGHIPGAVLLPVGSITAETAGETIPTTDTVVLVYCRSGNRSRTAAAALAELGYTRIYEFGGIQSWPYATES